MPRRIPRRLAVDARIVLDLDLPMKRAKAGAQIERHRAGMIMRAGMQPEPRDRARPRKLQRAIHQPAAGAAADELCTHTEEHDFAVPGLAKVELQQAFVTP